MHKNGSMSKIDTADYFKELPFCNKPIEKPKVKRLKNIDRLTELLFYEQLNVIKQSKHLVVMQCHIKLK